MSAQEKLQQAWSSIFPTRNRNAGGPQFFKWIHENATSPSEFDEMNKLYCGVSGSVVSPGRAPLPVKVKDLQGKQVCGEYHMCCWPCICDIEKYARAEPMTFDIGGETIERTMLTIPDPCAAPDRIPREVDTFRCEGGKTQNAVPASEGRIVMAMLHGDGSCTAKDADLVQRCEERNAMTSCALSSQGGMGDIFAALACAANKDAEECKC